MTEKGIPGKFIEVNKTACEMLCYTKEELMNMSLYDIAVPGTKEKVSNIMEKLLEKEHFTFKIKHKTKNGSLIPVEISSNLPSKVIVFAEQELRGTVYSFISFFQTYVDQHLSWFYRQLYK